MKVVTNIHMWSYFPAAAEFSTKASTASRPFSCAAAWLSTTNFFTRPKNLLNSGDFSSSICRNSLAASSYPCSLAFQSWNMHYEWVLFFSLNKRINCKGITIKVPCEHNVLLRAISYIQYLPPSWICFTCLRRVYLKYKIGSTQSVQNICNIKNIQNRHLNASCTVYHSRGQKVALFTTYINLLTL